MEDLSKTNKSDSKVYHNTKLLLTIYREVVWTVEDNLYDIEDIKDEFGTSSISNLVEFLSIDLEDYMAKDDKKFIEEKLMNIAESKCMIEIIDRALLKLRSHPHNGDMYFNILKHTYIDEDKLKDIEIQERYHLSSSSFYRYKKKAIEILSIIIWGYILPELRDFWEAEGALMAAEKTESYED